MAQSETQEKNKSAVKRSQKRKRGRVNELLIVIFVLIGTLLALAEMGTNVVNEMESRSANAISAPQPQPTATATLTPEELQKVLQENTQTN